MTTQRRSPPHRTDRRGPPVPSGRPGDPADEPLRRWESFIERRIRDAREAGAFDDLPYRGQPLPSVDDAYAGDQAAAFRILRNAGAAPGWIEADREVRRLALERAHLLDRAARASCVARRGLRERLLAIDRAHNAAVLRLNHEAPTTRQHRAQIDIDADLARLESTWSDPNAHR